MAELDVIGCLAVVDGDGLVRVDVLVEVDVNLDDVAADLVVTAVREAIVLVGVV